MFSLIIIFENINGVSFVAGNHDLAGLIAIQINDFHTAGLSRVYPTGLESFQRDLSKINTQTGKVIFTGEAGQRIPF